MMKCFLFLFFLSFSSPFFAYHISFEGDLPEEIFTTISAASQLNNDYNHPPPTFFILKKQAEKDKKTLLQVLHAFGYYDGEIEIHYSGQFPNTTVHIFFNLGQAYTFDAITILDQEKLALCLDTSTFKLKIGDPAHSNSVIETQEEILMQMHSFGYPLALVHDRKVLVDQENKSVSVTYIVQSGPLAYFGNLELNGLNKVKRRYIDRKIAWKTGEIYNPKLVSCTDNFLKESGLFSFVTVRSADFVDENGYLPMYIQLQEKNYRHIGAGISYSTDESIGLMAQWGHDNFTGWGDTLALNGEYSEIIQRATLIYAIPDIFGKDHNLLYSAEARRENTPGFIEKEISFLIRFNKQVNPLFFLDYAGRYERLLSTKSDNNSNYNLLSSPIQLRFDTSNNLLNPTSGTTIAYFFTPYQAIFNSHINFLRQELLVNTYQPLLQSGKILLAISLQIGAILGQSRYEIPAPKRFYAGSATSLRGYKYLSVSPLEGDKPIGGSSLMIGSIEPRFQVWDKIYLAPFYDIGNVYASSLPRFDKKVLTSTGIGIRYLTSLGPFCVDIGFPINKRKGIDKTFQIYASLGQKF
ncbi:MAG: BamA/TamA family outer membrane protein [Chlamydiales bacterium]